MSGKAGRSRSLMGEAKSDRANMASPIPPKARSLSGASTHSKLNSTGSSSSSLADFLQPGTSSPGGCSSSVSMKTLAAVRNTRGIKRSYSTSKNDDEEEDETEFVLNPTLPSSNLSVISGTGSNKSSSGSNKKKKGSRSKKASRGGSDAVEVVHQVIEDEYTVEKVVGRKFIDTEDGRKLHYNIKWKGWAPAHNTWEPLENLEGCQELVEKYEECRKQRRANGLEPEEDDKENMEDEGDELERMKKEIMEYGIESKWPTHLIPLQLVGVFDVDKQLCYLVQHKGTKGSNDSDLSSENCAIVKANVFRKLFPHIVIQYYEKCILFVKETSDEHEAEKKKADDTLKIKELEESEIEVDDCGMPIPKISIKKGEDLYGLPEDMSSSGGSDDENMFEPLIVPHPRSGIN